MKQRKIKGWAFNNGGWIFVGRKDLKFYCKETRKEMVDAVLIVQPKKK